MFLRIVVHYLIHKFLFKKVPFAFPPHQKLRAGDFQLSPRQCPEPAWRCTSGAPKAFFN